jgi:hypothetical protein
MMKMGRSTSARSHGCFIQGTDFSVPSHDERDEAGYSSATDDNGGANDSSHVPRPRRDGDGANAKLRKGNREGSNSAQALGSRQHGSRHERTTASDSRAKLKTPSCGCRTRELLLAECVEQIKLIGTSASRVALLVILPDVMKRIGTPALRLGPLLLTSLLSWMLLVLPIFRVHTWNTPFSHLDTTLKAKLQGVRTGPTPQGFGRFISRTEPGL